MSPYLVVLLVCRCAHYFGFFVEHLSLLHATVILVRMNFTCLSHNTTCSINTSHISTTVIDCGRDPAPAVKHDVRCRPRARDQRIGKLNKSRTGTSWKISVHHNEGMTCNFQSRDLVSPQSQREKPAATLYYSSTRGHG